MHRHNCITTILMFHLPCIQYVCTIEETVPDVDEVVQEIVQGNLEQINIKGLLKIMY